MSQESRIHKDVKLENLMLLAPSGPPHLVLIDLGVAETLHPQHRDLVQTPEVSSYNFVKFITNKKVPIKRVPVQCTQLDSSSWCNFKHSPGEVGPMPAGTPQTMAPEVIDCMLGRRSSTFVADETYVLAFWLC